MNRVSYSSMLLLAAIAVLPAGAAWSQTAGSATGDRAPLGQPSMQGSGGTVMSPGTANTSPATPGATGRTVVPGSNSTAAGNSVGTDMGKTSGSAGQGGGGGSAK